jgi:hypothetical protein
MRSWAHRKPAVSPAVYTKVAGKDWERFPEVVLCLAYVQLCS